MTNTPVNLIVCRPKTVSTGAPGDRQGRRDRSPAGLLPLDPIPSIGLTLHSVTALVVKSKRHRYNRHDSIPRFQYLKPCQHKGYKRGRDGVLRGRYRAGRLLAARCAAARS